MIEEILPWDDTACEVGYLVTFGSLLKESCD